MNFISKPTLVFGAISICTFTSSIAQADLPKAFDYSKASTTYVDNTSKKRSTGQRGKSFFEFGNVSNPYYFGGTIGASQGSGYCSGVSDCENEDTAWKLLTGFKVNDKLAAELAYSSLGDMHKTSPQNISDSTAFTVTAVGTLPLTEQFDIFAEGGLSRWNSDNEKGFGVTYGLGAKMHINASTNIRAEWQQFPSIEVSTDEKTDINMLSVGVEISTY